MGVWIELLAETFRNLFGQLFVVFIENFLKLLIIDKLCCAIGVGKQNIFTAGGQHTDTNSAAFSAILEKCQNTNSVGIEHFRIFQRDLTRPIGTAIVHNDQFMIGVFACEIFQSVFEHQWQTLFFVISGNDHGYAFRRWNEIFVENFIFTGQSRAQIREWMSLIAVGVLKVAFLR